MPKSSGEIPSWASFPLDAVVDGKIVPVYLEAFDSLLGDSPGLSREQFLNFPAAIVAPAFVSYAKEMLSQAVVGAELGLNNNTVTYYIDRGGSSPFFDDSGNDYKNKFGDSLTLNQDEYAPYIRQVMDEYEAASGGRLKVKEVFSDEQALLSIYRTPPPSGLLGVSLPTTNGSQKWRNVFYADSKGRGTDLRNLQDTKATIRHEIGHSLGFAHPDDLSTATYYGRRQDGFNTAYEIGDTDPNHTVMSYNVPVAGDIGFGLSPNDVEAFFAIWGDFQAREDMTEGLRLNKSGVFAAVRTAAVSGKDVVTGLGGDDVQKDSLGDDFYDLRRGGDKLIYRGGYDFARGGKGKDVFVLKPKTERGYLVVEDFNSKKDSFVIKGVDSNIETFSFGGSTFVLGSDTDALAMVKGHHDLSALGING